MIRLGAVSPSTARLGESCPHAGSSVGTVFVLDWETGGSTGFTVMCESGRGVVESYTVPLDPLGLLTRVGVASRYKIDFVGGSVDWCTGYYPPCDWLNANDNPGAPYPMWSHQPGSGICTPTATTAVRYGSSSRARAAHGRVRAFWAATQAWIDVVNQGPVGTVHIV